VKSHSAFGNLLALGQPGGLIGGGRGHSVILLACIGSADTDGLLFVSS
jgi:hypothetical protein